MALSALSRPPRGNDSLYFMESNSTFWHVRRSFIPGLPVLSRKESLMSIREELIHLPADSKKPFTPATPAPPMDTDDKSLVSIETVATMETAPQFQKSPRQLSTEFPRGLGPHDQSTGAPGFQRWLKSLYRKRRGRRVGIIYPSFQDNVSDDEDRNAVASVMSSRAGSMAASPSLRFVTAVRTASITFASISIGGGGGGAASMGRRRNSAVTLDTETILRMRDRRCALEELINTEEYYIADLRILVNLYMSVLHGCEGIPADIKEAITRNVSEILDLHERLLAEIFHVLPAASHQIQTYKGRTSDMTPPVEELAGIHVLANPMAAAKVAMVFDKMIRGFFVYEEYCAKYEVVTEKFKEFRGSSWSMRERGCEVLAGAINSQDNQEEYGKRALALSDMLVKPIQRICKYPLLFGEIVKCTPAMDCPESNQLLEKVRYRLEETAHQINLATFNGPKIRDRMEKTWLLQDRLGFKEKASRSPSDHLAEADWISQPDFSVRLLGQIILCGVLHVAWQGPTIPVGEYLACLLYKSYLLFARVPKSGDRYDVKFAVTLATARIEEANQGQGLNCYSALFSWKVIFEARQQIYEVLLSACSATEEDVWRSQIAERVAAEGKDYNEYSSANLNLFPPVTSDIRSLGHVFGRPGTLARRQSLHRPRSTPPTKSDVIIINNTHALSEVIGSKSNSTGLSRSASVLIAGQMTILSPKRTERNRIESKLTDVWTRDLLPFGSMASGGVRKRDASNLMRRLSAVSLVSSARKSMQSLHSSASPSEASSIQSWEIAASTDPGILMGVAVNAATEGIRASSSHHSLSKRAATISRAFSFSGRFSEHKNGMKGAGAAEVQTGAMKENANSASELDPPEVVVTPVASTGAEEAPTDTGPAREKSEPASRPRFSIILSASHPRSLPSKFRRKKLRISAKRMEGRQ